MDSEPAIMDVDSSVNELALELLDIDPDLIEMDSDLLDHAFMDPAFGMVEVATTTAGIMYGGYSSALHLILSKPLS